MPPTAWVGLVRSFLSRTRGFSTSQTVSIFLYVMSPRLRLWPGSDAHSPHFKDKENDGRGSYDSDSKGPCQVPNSALFNKYFSLFCQTPREGKRWGNATHRPSDRDKAPKAWHSGMYLFNPRRNPEVSISTPVSKDENWIKARGRRQLSVKNAASSRSRNLDSMPTYVTPANPEVGSGMWRS